ncbi:hypothetical protein V498_06887 [Pseudogymnoascus sp. VKM F-4517 (FW-2822)]|nr:hypothetical protein V498_06887 [Pseudogymnoascus sp. VKM F-4517 (FW-2822)]
MPRKPKPHHRNPRPERLAHPTKHRTPTHRLRARPERQVQRERHREAFGDVMHEQRHEDREPERGRRVVRRVRDEALRQLVQRDRDAGLQPDVQECVLGHVVVVRGGVLRVELGVGAAL